jgi:hypothetical protein
MGQLLPSLVFYLFVLVLCLIRPAAGRVFVGVFFLVMAVGVNVVISLFSPDLFVGLGANAPLLTPYRWFFENVVASTPLLFGLLAATYEITIVQPSATIFNAVMISGGLMIVTAAYFVQRAFGRLRVTVPLTVWGVGVLGVGLFPAPTGGVHDLFALLTYFVGPGRHFGLQGRAAAARVRLGGSGGDPDLDVVRGTLREGLSSHE